MIFHADSESDLKTTPNHVKTRFFQKLGLKSGGGIGRSPITQGPLGGWAYGHTIRLEIWFKISRFRPPSLGKGKGKGNLRPLPLPLSLIHI